MRPGEEFPRHLAAVLRFEARHAATPEPQLKAAVAQAFGLSLLRYRQRLALAVKTPGAEAIEPATVRRLKAVLIRSRQRRAAGVPRTGVPTR